MHQVRHEELKFLLFLNPNLENLSKQQIENIFQRQAGINDFKLDAVVPSEQIFNYRNKMEFTFSNNRWVLPGEPEGVSRDFALGMHIPKRWDKILNIDKMNYN